MRSRIYGNFVLLLFVMASNCALCQTIKCDFSSANNVIEANINGGQKVRLMLDDYASEKNITLKKLYKKRIDALREAPNEYAMATRSLIKAALSR